MKGQESMGPQQGSWGSTAPVLLTGKGISGCLKRQRGLLWETLLAAALLAKAFSMLPHDSFDGRDSPWFQAAY